MARALYGTNLDSLGQAAINEEDQNLRERTANQNFLAQLAGERTRRRGVEASYDVGLRGQETARIGSQRALDAALSEAAARMNVADVTSGRGLEGQLASANAQRGIADSYANASKYQADALSGLDRMRLDLERAKLAVKPQLSEEFQLKLMENAEAARQKAADAEALEDEATRAAAPTWTSAFDPAVLGGYLWGGYGGVIPPLMRGQKARTQAWLDKKKAEGVDITGLAVEPKSGIALAKPADERYARYLSRANEDVFGMPEGYAPYEGKTWTPPSTGGLSDLAIPQVPAAVPSAPGVRRVRWDEATQNITR